MIGWNPGRIVVVVAVAMVFGWNPVAHATVYSWTGAGGVLMMSNDPSDVPDDQRTSVQEFTSKPAARPPANGTADAEGAADDAYGRGFDAGMQTAERQVALAEDLARTLAASIPPAPPPAPVIIEQSAPVQPDVGDNYPPPYWYGAPPYATYGFPYTFVSFAPHRRFLNGIHGHRFDSPFGHGNAWRTSPGGWPGTLAGNLTGGWSGGWSGGSSGGSSGRMR